MEVVVFLQIGLLLGIALAVTLLLVIYSQNQASPKREQTKRQSALMVRDQQISLS